MEPEPGQDATGAREDVDMIAAPDSQTTEVMEGSTEEEGKQETKDSNMPAPDARAADLPLRTGNHGPILNPLLGALLC